IALFDKPAYWDRKPVETKVPMDRAKFEEQARELQIAIDELNKRIITRSKVWLKKHQPDDAERTKAQLQTLKRQDTKERDEKVSQLHELRARLKNWGADDRDCNVVTTWENQVLLMAIHYNMVHPTPEALRKHPWLRRWEPEPDDSEHDAGTLA